MSQTEEALALVARGQREMRATADDVFDAFVDPEKLKRWLSPLDGKAGAVEATVDLRVGGTWETRFRPNEQTEVHDVQTFVEIDRPHRLVADLVSESTIGGERMPALRGRARITFTPTDSGAIMAIERSGFPSVELRDFFETVAMPAAFDRIEAYLVSR